MVVSFCLAKARTGNGGTVRFLPIHNAYQQSGGAQLRNPWISLLGGTYLLLPETGIALRLKYEMSRRIYGASARVMIHGVD